jgi:hypothetical protein
VLAFLKLLVQVKVHALVLGISDVHTLLILYPYTVGILSNSLSKAISTGCSVDKLRSALPESPTCSPSINRPFPSNSSPRPRPTIECFYCHRQGHVISNYPVRPPRRGGNHQNNGCNNYHGNNTSNNNHTSDPHRSSRAPQGQLFHTPKSFLASDNAWCLGVHTLPSRFVPQVCVQISDCKVCALLDSGSTCSVIPFSLYNKLRQLRKVAALKELPVTCLTATSQPLNIVGQVRCKRRLDRYTWVVPLLVSDNLVCPRYTWHRFSC